MKFSASIAAAATAAFLVGAGAAQAATVTVTPGGAWSVVPGETSGGGSAVITDSAARSGNGSVEMTGDKARFAMGDLFSPASNLGAASGFTDLSFEFMIAPGSTSNYDADYTPALRLTVWDGGSRDEYIWEGAYNGLYGTIDPGVWIATSSSSLFYKKSLGDGTEKTLADWLGSASANAYVSAVYIGVGSGVGTGYHIYADNVTANGTTYNFETASTGGAVPEPATWAMMVLGFGAIGSLVRGQRRREAA